MNKPELLVSADSVFFYKELAEVFGINGALYVQSLYIQSDKTDREDGFIYKTKDEIQRETLLTLHQQDRVRSKLEKLGVLETKLIKVLDTPTLHYRLNVAKINELLESIRG